MATVINHKIDGQPFDAIREVRGKTISPIFGINIQPVFDLGLGRFVNTDNYLTSNLVRSLQQNNPIEGGVYSFEMEGTTADGILLTENFDFFFDYTRLKLISDSETEVGLIKDRSLDSLIDFSGADITMLLLESKGILTNSDYENIPYVIHNRKTVLERLQLISQFFTILKTGIDEVFKIINIAADITTLGNVQALINLSTTIAALILLIQQLGELIMEIHISFFPPILYHSGIKLKTFLTKSCEYLGYDIDFGVLWEEIDNIVLCPSKNDEQGAPIALPVVPTSGILNPGDFGYNLADAFELARKMANVHVGIFGNVVHVRPKKDPFWITNSSFILPSIRIEDSPFVQNGIQRYNYEDLHAATITEYVTDESDYWTIQKLAEGDANGDRISVASVEPTSVGVQRRVKIGPPVTNEIPYALCVRKDTLDDLNDTLDDLIDFFFSLTDELENTKLIIEQAFGEVSDVLTESFPLLAALDTFTFNRDGAMKVENHFFSTPKMVLLGSDERIPADFNSKIGAKAIYDKYFAYDSLVPGVRNPDNLDDTNGKRIYEGVNIPFTLENFTQILNNSYFSSEDLGIGQIIKLDWSFSEDKATIDFWVQDNWLNNVEETQS